MTSAADLPDDIDALKAMLIAAEAQIGAQNKTIDERDGIIERKEDRIIRLEKLLADFKRALYGAKSEWGQARTQVSAKSPTGEALKYIAKYWEGLILFLDDGRIEMDSNAVERTIRPIALQRKNALFAGHDAGAQNWAMLASLIETCKLNHIEPHSYLTGVLTAIVSGHKQKDIDQLLPWNFKG